MEIDIFNTEKKYNVIYADPPWKYNDRTCEGAREKHYDTMKIEDIKQLPIKELCEKDCVLFLWTTYPMLKEALELIEAWGFKYKSIAFQWIKLNRSGNGKFFGLGRWTRGNTEPVLLATKGKPSRKSNSVSQLIEYPLGKHSAKPPITREKIKELMGEEARCFELFARNNVEGRDCWGNEVGKLDNQNTSIGQTIVKNEEIHRWEDKQMNMFDLLED